MNDFPEDELLTVPEVARVLRVTDRCIRGWIADGTIPAFRIGDKAIRIKNSDVRKMLRPVNEPARKAADSDSPAWMRDMGLGTRARNALVRNGVLTKEALGALSVDDVRDMRQVGGITLRELLNAIATVKREVQP